MSSSEGLALLAGEVYGRIDDRQRPMPSENGQHAVRVLVVAPGRLHREGLAMLLGGRAHVVGAAGTANEALALLRETAPDAVVVDVAAGGLAAIRPIAREAKVVALGPWSDGRLVAACAEAGVAAYADVDSSVDALHDVLDGAARGEFLCPPPLASTLLGALARGAPPAPRLTPRESEILALVDQGLSNKAIAARLQIRLATVKNHIHNVLEKLQVDGRAAAAARAREAGLSPPRALG
jgi:two-component system nitrate/nitrite response regulator NarL